MERYLTKKSAGMRWWEIPVAALSALFTGIGVEVCVEELLAEGLDFTDVEAYVLLFVMFAGPLGLVIRRWLRRRWARRLAQALAPLAQEAVPLEALDRATGIPRAEDRIRQLTHQGYLQRLILDSENECLWLYRSRG